MLPVAITNDTRLPLLLQDLGTLHAIQKQYVSKIIRHLNNIRGQNNLVWGELFNRSRGRFNASDDLTQSYEWRQLKGFSADLLRRSHQLLHNKSDWFQQGREIYIPLHQDTSEWTERLNGISQQVRIHKARAGIPRRTRNEKILRAGMIQQHVDNYIANVERRMVERCARENGTTKGRQSGEDEDKGAPEGATAHDDTINVSEDMSQSIKMAKKGYDRENDLAIGHTAAGEKSGEKGEADELPGEISNKDTNFGRPQLSASQFPTSYVRTVIENSQGLSEDIKKRQTAEYMLELMVERKNQSTFQETPHTEEEL